MNLPAQDKLAQDIAALLFGIFAVAMSLFGVWMGRTSTAGRWPRPQATGVFSLFAVGMVGVALGVNLASWIDASWGQPVGLTCVLIGGLLICLAYCWLGFLRLRYPLEPAYVGDTRRRHDRRLIVAESFSIAWTIASVAGVATYWISDSILLAMGVVVAVAVPVFGIAPLLLNRLPHRRAAMLEP